MGSAVLSSTYAISRNKNKYIYVSTLCIAAPVLVREVVATGPGARDSLLQNGIHAGPTAHPAINGQLLNDFNGSPAVGRDGVAHAGATRAA